MKSHSIIAYKKYANEKFRAGRRKDGVKLDCNEKFECKGSGFKVQGSGFRVNLRILSVFLTLNLEP